MNYCQGDRVDSQDDGPHQGEHPGEGRQLLSFFLPEFLATVYHLWGDLVFASPFADNDCLVWQIAHFETHHLKTVDSAAPRSSLY